MADIFELVLDYFQPIELFRFTSDGQLEISVGNLSKAFIFVPFVIGYLLFLLAALASAKTPEDARGMLLAFVGIPLLFGVCFPQVFAIAMTNIFLLFGWLVGLPVVVFGGVDLGVSCSRNMKLAFTLFAIAVLFVIVFRSHPISLFVAFWLRLIAIVVGAWHVAEWMYRSDADNTDEGARILIAGATLIFAFFANGMSSNQAHQLVSFTLKRTVDLDPEGILRILWSFIDNLFGIAVASGFVAGIAALGLDSEQEAQESFRGCFTLLAMLALIALGEFSSLI